jgi:uncharacterized protein (TIGR03435 family)
VPDRETGLELTDNAATMTRKSVFVAAVASIGVVMASFVAAQTPAFDVVSIKESTSNSGSGFAGPEGTSRFVATNYPASGLLNMAWRLPNGRVIGAPDWTPRINYDIDARGDVSSDAAWRAKLQAMLRDRFKLVAHLEKRDLPVYHLVRLRADRLGPGLVKSRIVDCNDKTAIAALTPPPRPCGFGPSPTATLAGTMALSSVASLLSTAAGRPVIDMTGIEGNYDFDLKFSRATSDDALSVFTAVQEQLGLKLESATAPLDVLVVEHMERPTRN